MTSDAHRVLIVEDTVSNLKMLEAKLLLANFTVEVASDGVEALRKLEVQQFDIVVLDVMMPGIDGLEVCRRIKLQRGRPIPPVIMLTALDSLADREAGMDAGADDFFVKPVEDQILFRRMLELIERQPAQRCRSETDAWSSKVTAG